MPLKPLLAAVLLVLGCASGDSAGAPDASLPDASLPDASLPDAGAAADAGGDDASQPDAGRPPALELTATARLADAATATVDEDTQTVPGGPDATQELTAGTHGARATGTRASAEASTEIRRDDASVTFVSRIALASQGAETSARSLVDRIELRARAAGAKKFKLSFTCAGTLSFTGSGSVAATVSAGEQQLCVAMAAEGFERPWVAAAPLVVDAADGAASFGDNLEVNVLGIAGYGERGTADADVRITLTVERVD